ncbi:nuclear hormone receptor family member odr-7, putative [Brugia malayi]|uniref:Nuclear hormone receptor family member odr-7, putative n=1 Tax=Brugia malayi TaxID=6279 RepID=A0A4E9F049_BRUMA|nr:nuclear hormone receptor family member odr-7, putative [Brugia malayi]VIO89376.1 nuclear hormone receptor family member odr-7, putative [Brugia malayi]
MDNKNCGNIWQHGFTLSQHDEYHYHVESAPIPVLRDPIRDATTSSFLFWDYDPTFCTNIGQTVSNNFTAPHCIVPLSPIPDSSSSFTTLPVRQMIKTATTPIYSSSHPYTVKDFSVPLPTRFSSEQSYPLLSFDTSNTLSTPSIPQQSAPRTISSVITKKTTGEQLCQVCLAAASNGSHFGAKTCAACAAFFRRTVSDEKNYICKRSQRCDVKLNYATGYRKICRSCRMKRCLHIGMLPENVQNKRQRKEYKENFNYQNSNHNDSHA